VGKVLNVANWIYSVLQINAVFSDLNVHEKKNGNKIEGGVR